MLFISNSAVYHETAMPQNNRLLKKHQIIHYFLLWVLREGVSWSYPGYSQFCLLPPLGPALWGMHENVML